MLGKLRCCDQVSLRLLVVAKVLVHVTEIAIEDLKTHRVVRLVDQAQCFLIVLARLAKVAHTLEYRRQIVLHDREPAAIVRELHVVTRPEVLTK